MSDTRQFVPSLEKGVFSTFRQQFVTFRQGQFGSKLVDFTKLQLPTNSCLHICNNYMESPVTSILPNLEDPFIKNEQYKLLMDFVLTIPDKNDSLFPVTDSFRFRPYSYNSIIRQFYTEHKNIKRFTTRESALSASNSLPILNYDVISTVIVTGTFVYYRKFDILFRTILKNISTIEGKHQYLQIELSKTLYRKSQFQQTFDKINYQTVRIKDDPSFYFLIQLINFLSKKATTSLFSRLTQVQLDQLNLILTAGNKAIIYNMGDLKAIVDSRNDDNFYQMVIRHIMALKLAGYADLDISELNETQVDKLIDDVAPPENTISEIEPASPEIPISSLHNITSPDKKHLENTDKSKTESTPEPQIPTIDIPGKQPILRDTSKVNTTVSKEVGAPNKKPVQLPLLTKIEIPTESQSIKPYDPNKFTSVIDYASHALISNDPHLTDDQKDRLLKISQYYKNLEVDGTSIEELLDQTPEPDITKSHLSFLNDKVVDSSMLNSTVMDLDKHYIQHLMAKDIASISVQMATNGMFLTDVFQKDEITNLNRIRSYKLTYEDVQGRKHRVAFKLPIVSSDGTVLINGIESRMIKQQVNLPICKIDNWRVSLSSNYNKTIVERVTAKAHNYSSYITKYISAVYKAKVGLDINYGHFTSENPFPYDYTSIAKRYSKLQFSGYNFTFDYNDRFSNVELNTSDKIASEAVSFLRETLISDLKNQEKKYGIYCGTESIRSSSGPLNLFFGYDNYIRAINSKNEILWKSTFTNLFFSVFEEKVPVPKSLSEWTELKILDKNFPIVFILGFEFGLKRTLDHIKLDYKFYPKDEKFTKEFTTIVIPFSDGNLVFDRYPLEKSFIASGLLKFNTKLYEFDKFNTQDVYYTLLQDNSFSMNYLKGIKDFFNLFIDPITRDVLLKMHEPTDPAGLLLRATQMLTTDNAIPSASMKNHRLRGYERFSSILYNEMARSYASYANQRGNRKIFSINPDAVFLRIIQDQTLHIVDEINPMENIKDKHAITYAGTGGRTAQSFVIEDRRYPEDGVGILSECTPDSGKVALNAYMTANPVIQNIRGMYDTDSIDIDKLEPSQIISVTSLLMPCSTNDDPRRSNYLSTQMKHHVPSQFSETNRVRTGYELVAAHRTGETFACTAQRDGVVEEVNQELGLIKIKYNSIDRPSINLSYISSSNIIKNKFLELAKNELTHLRPIYIIQEDEKTSHFKPGEYYSLDKHTLKVVDISPLDLNNIPMDDYLTQSAKDALKKAKNPVLIKLIPQEDNPANDVDIFKFGTKFSSVAGSYLKQDIVANVKTGDRISTGDVIAYNTGFFEPDPFDSKQVTWKHGVMANIALMEVNDTIEDSNAITEEFSRRMQMEPAHLRVLELTSNNILKDLLPIGTEVQTTDLLCNIEDADIGSLTESDDSSMLDLLTELNRKAPRSRYHGIISEIDVLYSCPVEDMHPSVAEIVKKINAKKLKVFKEAKETLKSMYYTEPSQVAVGTKYHGIEFQKDTILFLIYISEHINHGVGDKLVVCNQAKSVSASVIEKPIFTESGYPVDMLFSARSISNRILLSPTVIGFTNRVLHKAEESIIDMYFND